MVARTNAEDRGLNRQSSIRPWVVMKIYLANKDSNKHFPYIIQEYVSNPLQSTWYHLV